jgi:hypothetical protein
VINNDFGTPVLNCGPSFLNEFSFAPAPGPNPPPILNPPSITSLVRTQNSTLLDLTWSSVSPLPDIISITYNSLTGTPTQTSVVGNETFLRINPLVAGTQYIVRGQSFKSQDDIMYSSSAFITSFTTVPINSFVGIDTASLSTQVSVFVTASTPQNQYACSTTYYLFRNNIPTPVSLGTVTQPLVPNTFDFTGLAPSTQYFADVG